MPDDAGAGRAGDALRRCRLRIRGQVQGVGFRPHVFALAQARGLTGWVINDADGVLAEVQGRGVPAFLAALVAEAPPLARIDDLRVEERPPVDEAGGFAIRQSAGGDGGQGVSEVALRQRLIQRFLKNVFG